MSEKSNRKDKDAEFSELFEQINLLKNKLNGKYTKNGRDVRKGELWNNNRLRREIKDVITTPKFKSLKIPAERLEGLTNAQNTRHEIKAMIDDIEFWANQEAENYEKERKQKEDEKNEAVSKAEEKVKKQAEEDKAEAVSKAREEERKDKNEKVAQIKHKYNKEEKPPVPHADAETLTENEVLRAKLEPSTLDNLEKMLSQARGLKLLSKLPLSEINKLTPEIQMAVLNFRQLEDKAKAKKWITPKKKINRIPTLSEKLKIPSAMLIRETSRYRQ